MFLIVAEKRRKRHRCFAAEVAALRDGIKLTAARESVLRAFETGGGSTGTSSAADVRAAFARAVPDSLFILNAVQASMTGTTTSRSSDR